MTAGTNPFSSNPDMEVELSTQDLISLTPSGTASTQPAAVASHSSPRVAPATATPIRFRIPAPRVIGALGLVLIALIAIGALFEFAPPQRVIDRPVSHWAPVPDPITAVAEEPAAPTLFANPFDASEVFELPPGLTQDQARAMVAELLLQRAGERHAYTSRKH